MDAELAMIDHLLRMMMNSGADVKALIFVCSMNIKNNGIKINYPLSTALLKYISNSEEVHFSWVKPSVRTMEEVAKHLGERKWGVKMMKISFYDCYLTDAKVLPILPHLVNIEQVSFQGRSEITMETYKHLLKEIQGSNTIALTKLFVGGAADQLKTLFKDYPSIQICNLP